MMTTNKIPRSELNQLRNHATRNISYLLDKMHVVYNDRGSHIQGRCPCLQHGGDGDNETAFSWRTDIGKWVCWTHHCEDSQKGNDIFGLVSSVLGFGFKDTVEWVSDRLGEKNIDVQDEVKPIASRPAGQLHIHEPLKLDHMSFLRPDPVYLLNRGYDQEILRDYNVGLWSRVGTFMHDRVVFPIKDHEGHLIGYTGRTIHPESYFKNRDIKYYKWVHGRYYDRWPKSGDIFTSSILFNLDRAKNFIPYNKKIILVEGPLDGMRLAEAGINNWVGTLSTNFCHTHRTLLVKYGVTDIYVAYDADDPSKYKDNQSPGQKGWNRIQRVVGDLFNLHRVELPPGTDCGDLEPDFVKELFKGISC